MTLLRQKLIVDYIKHINFIENLLKDGIEKLITCIAATVRWLRHYFT